MYGWGPTEVAAFSQRRRTVVSQPYQIAEISQAAEGDERHKHGGEHTYSDHCPSLDAPRTRDVTIGYQS